MKIVLDSIPFPPSSNHCRSSFFNRSLGRMTHYDSKEYKGFKKDFARWADPRGDLLHQARLALSPSKWQLLKVDAFFCVVRSRLYAKNGNRKQWDVSNRIKPLHDALAEAIGIDDRFFYPGLSEPVIVEEETMECVMVQISKTALRRREQVVETVILPAGGS